MDKNTKLSDAFPKYDLWSYLSERSEKEENIYLYGTGDGADKIIAVCEKYGIKIDGVFASDDFYKKADGSRRFFRGMQILCFDEVLHICSGRKPIVLVAFASTLPDVIENIKRVAERSELYIPDVPVAGENLFTLDFAHRNQDKIEEARGLLYDEESKRIFDSVILGKITGKLDILLDGSDDGSFFRDIIRHNDISSYADLGAYNGDTVSELLFVKPTVTDIYALEPDRKTYEKLMHNIDLLETEANIRTYNVAAWNEKTTLCFAKKSNRGSTLLSGNTYNTQSNNTKISETARAISVEADSLDNIMAGKTLDYIKYDVEGAEREALIGAENTIKQSQPLITLSLYHRPEDIFALVLQLGELCPNYHFFLRRKCCLPAWEINLYAVPDRYM